MMNHIKKSNLFEIFATEWPNTD